MSIGIPVKVLHECEGHIITCETIDGVYYRGKLVEAEDSMNLQMTNITATNRDGSVTKMSSCFLRGSKIVFINIPSILAHAPVLNKIAGVKSGQPAPAADILKGRGRGHGRGGPNIPRSRR